MSDKAVAIAENAIMRRVYAWIPVGAIAMGAMVGCSQGEPSLVDTANDNGKIDASVAKDAGTHKDAGASKDAAMDAGTSGADASDAASVEAGDGGAIGDGSEPG